MKSVLVSIRPKWCKKIMSGEKTAEVRKTKPNLKPPFKCYIYCTAGTGKNTINIPITTEQLFDDLCETGSMKSLNCPIGNQKVIGEFVCNFISSTLDPACGLVDVVDVEESCLSPKEIIRYANGEIVHFWHISDLKIYDKPKDITDFAQCHKCDYFAYCRDRELSCDGTYVLHRPPQSWCYVEAL